MRDKATTPPPPDAAARHLAEVSAKTLNELLAELPAQAPVKAQVHGRTLGLPPGALALLRDALVALSEGHGVTVVATEAELTTQQAADILNVSRPHLVKLLEQGALPHRKAGTHRRIPYEAVMAYKHQQDTESEVALQALADQAQTLEMGYEAEAGDPGLIRDASWAGKRARQAAFSRWLEANPDMEVPRSKLIEGCKLEPGAPFRDDSIDILTQEFRFTMDELAGLLEVSVGALKASREEGSAFTLGERPAWLLHDIHTLMKQACETLGSSEAAARWIREPIAALNGDTPLSRLTHHDGVRQVDTLLDKINEGFP